MAGSQARKNKRANPVGNEDRDNPKILKATIDNLKLSLGANKLEDAVLRQSIFIIEERLKNATGGNPNDQPRPKKSRPWR